MTSPAVKRPGSGEVEEEGERTRRPEASIERPRGKEELQRIGVSGLCVAWWNASAASLVFSVGRCLKEEGRSSHHVQSAAPAVLCALINLIASQAGSRTEALNAGTMLSIISNDVLPKLDTPGGLAWATDEQPEGAEWQRTNIELGGLSLSGLRTPIQVRTHAQTVQHVDTDMVFTPKLDNGGYMRECVNIVRYNRCRGSRQRVGVSLIKGGGFVKGSRGIQAGKGWRREAPESWLWARPRTEERHGSSRELSVMSVEDEDGGRRLAGVAVPYAEIGPTSAETARWSSLRRLLGSSGEFLPISCYRAEVAARAQMQFAGSPSFALVAQCRYAECHGKLSGPSWGSQAATVYDQEP
ncbi:hypothetical protein FB45DRAFT_1104498 [Roridomyces roridus]|uniref:Uncharacterized protein n=1 Tax=Roridomyces roridus TaxID=1738132 RepID=A0AAD7BCG9_9AGAR|nr:hypothetical protein FB45DRAFT_1104498 [Roridomyces roridus]